MSTTTKESLEKRFNELIREGQNQETPFATLVLKWIRFCIEIVVDHGMKTSDVAPVYKGEGGYVTHNYNDDIIPSLGKSFAKACEQPHDPAELYQALVDLDYFFTLYCRFRDPNVRLWKMSKSALSDFVQYANCTRGESLVFFLNLSDEQFAFLSSKTVPDSCFSYFNKPALEKIFHDCMFGKCKTPDAAFEYIQRYPHPVPNKELMYRWLLEKFPKIPTDTLVEYSKTTRSPAVTKALYARPSEELPWEFFVLQQKMAV